MRICVLSTSYPRSESDDAGIFIKRLVEAYSKDDLGGLVIVPFDEKEAPRSKVGNFEIRRFKYGLFFRGRLAFGAGIMPNLRRNPLLFFQIPLFLLGFTYHAFTNRKRCDVIQTNWAITACSAWLNYILCRKPYIVTLRGEDMRLLRRRLVRWMMRPVFKRAAFITSVNQEFISKIKEYYRLPDEKLKCIPNGITMPHVSEESLAEFAEQKGLDLGGKYLLFVGTVIKRKRVDELVRLLIEKQMEDYQLLICGRLSDLKYAAQVQELAEELNCSSRLRLLGQVSPFEVPFYYKLASVFVSASEFEGRPNAVLEAFAAGLVVFASDIPAHREIIQDGKNGFLFSSGKTEELSQLITQAVRSEAALENVRAAALAETENYSWEITVAQYREVFEAAISL